MEETIQRKVHFFHTTLDPDDERSKDFHPKKICEAIRQLDFASGEAYMNISTADSIAAWDESKSGQHRISIGTVRHSGLSEIEEHGKKSPLKIKDEQNLLEQTHVVFFDNGIVGAEFNFHGPRMNRLAHYLVAKCNKSLPVMAFNPIFKKDVVSEAAHFKDVRLFQIRLTRPYLALLAKANSSLAAALEQTSLQLNAPIVEIMFKQTPHAEEGMGKAAVKAVKDLIGIKDIRENADVFKVKALDDRTSQIAEFDLLQDKFVGVVTVATQDARHRSVEPENMFAAIVQAYDNIKDELKDAVSAQLEP